jgi:putative ABC transport system ATP-binding protein
MNTVEAHNITKSIPLADEPINILKEVNLVVKQAETVSILGVSGAGKSTLLSLMAGLDDPSKGEIILLGQRLNQCNEEQRSNIRQAQIGFVFQNFFLLPQFTATENVMLACEIAGIDGAYRKAQDILCEVGLEARLNHYPKKLSGGEQQRVALARAFVTNPKIIFADEPTGSLDEKTGQAVIDKLYALNEKFQTTLVMVTHDKQVSRRSQSVYTLTDGVLRPQG